MNINLDKDEAALVLDALAALPLARSYNLFQRLLGMVQAQQKVPPAPDLSDLD